MGYLENALWKRTLGEHENDRWAKERSVLRNSFDTLRANVKWLLESIGTDLPHFTVHDVSHSDALWDMADLILGPEYQLTPMEAFVLGATFLIHDAGLSAATRQDPNLRSSTRWCDTLALTIRRRTGRTPSPGEMLAADEDTKRVVFESLLRETHSEAVRDLLTREWTNAGKPLYLLESADLRENYAGLIAEIAASHWWPVSRLREHFKTELGSVVGFPQQWTVNPLKLACALRVADAAHLDARRAPRFLMALRSPVSVSEAHWVFQKRLHQPRIDSDRLIYTSAEAFGAGEVQAWWFCFQALAMVDQELRAVDSILTEQDLPRFTARGVLGSDEPKGLTRYVPTLGWAPVDTRIRVGGVANLVRQLGGEQLYAEGPSVALRELIQNSADAIRARSLAEDRQPGWGEVMVSLNCRSGDWWLSVADNGVGMSDALLTGPFLDFGSSYWNSDLLIAEHPGLLTRGFQPVGRFGIGFFSVFMLGDVVRITTRPYREAQRETRVLEFSSGVSSVPLLRFAELNDQLHDGGTRVEVLLRTSPTDEAGLLNRIRTNTPRALTNLVRYLCPASTVNIRVSENGSPAAAVVGADDWEKMAGNELIARCNIDANATDATRLGKRVRDIRDSSGNLVGRAAVYSWMEAARSSRLDGVTAIGGFRAAPLDGISGVFLARPLTADRSEALPLADGQQLADWATEQGELMLADWRKDAEDPESLMIGAGVVYACGGDTGTLPICLSKKVWMDAEAIASWGRTKKEILLIDAQFLRDSYRFVDEFDLMGNVLVIQEWSQPVPLKQIGQWPSTPPVANRWWRQNQRSLKGLIIHILARVWGVSVDDVIAASEFTYGDDWVWRDIATAGGRDLSEAVDVIRRPGAAPRVRSRQKGTKRRA
jgi:hypothetical protein